MLTTEKRSRISTRPACYRREDFVSWLSERMGADFSELLEHLPIHIYRKDYDRLRREIGLPFTKSTLENLDSLGQGPKRLM